MNGQMLGWVGARMGIWTMDDRLTEGRMDGPTGGRTGEWRMDGRTGRMDGRMGGANEWDGSGWTAWPDLIGEMDYIGGME